MTCTERTWWPPQWVSGSTGWEAGNEAIYEAATEHRALTAWFYDEFNGLEHDEDADEKGDISGDDRHASSAGILVQADVLHAHGHDPIVP